MTTRTGLAAAVVRSWRLSKDVRDLERIKRFIDLHPAYCHVTCREAAAMTAWELGQNLAKYGIEDDDGGSGTMTVEIGTRITRIGTVNLAEADHDAEAVMTTVARLSSVRAAAELYRSRVVSLLEEPVQARASRSSAHRFRRRFSAFCLSRWCLSRDRRRAALRSRYRSVFHARPLSSRRSMPDRVIEDM